MPWTAGNGRSGKWRQSSWLIQIDFALRRGSVRVLLNLPQHLVELLLQYLAVHLLALDRFAKDFVAPAGFAFQLGNCGGQILNCRRLFGYFVRNHRLRLRINFKHRLAAGTLDLDEFGHKASLTRRAVRRSTWLKDVTVWDSWRESDGNSHWR